MPEPAPTADASLVRLAALHAAIVAFPVLLILLALRLWIVALPVAVVIGVGVTAVRMRGIDDRIAREVGARPVGQHDEPRLAGLAESVAMAAGVPCPRLFVIDTPSVNAITWGVANGPHCLAVTAGLLASSDPIAIEAVVGHQLAPVHTGSVDEKTLAAALFGPLTRGPLAGPLANLVRGDDERSVVLADLEGVRSTRYPPGMVRVLESLREQDTTLHVPPALAGLCFAAPSDADDVFAVHPPLDDRIDLLREI